MRLELPNPAQKAGAASAQPPPVRLEALQHGHVALAQHGAADPPRVAVAGPVAARPHVVIARERRGCQAGGCGTSPTVVDIAMFVGSFGLFFTLFLLFLRFLPMVAVAEVKNVMDQAHPSHH